MTCECESRTSCNNRLKRNIKKNVAVLKKADLSHHVAIKFSVRTISEKCFSLLQISGMECKFASPLT